MDKESQQAKDYRDLVDRYELTGEAIQALINKHGGHTENMSKDDMEQYRELADLRDTLHNQMKAIEADWFSDNS